MIQFVVCKSFEKHPNNLMLNANKSEIKPTKEPKFFDDFERKLKLKFLFFFFFIFDNLLGTTESETEFSTQRVKVVSNVES